MAQQDLVEKDDLIEALEEGLKDLEKVDTKFLKKAAL